MKKSIILVLFVLTLVVSASIIYFSSDSYRSQALMAQSESHLRQGQINSAMDTLLQAYRLNDNLAGRTAEIALALIEPSNLSKADAREFASILRRSQLFPGIEAKPLHERYWALLKSADESLFSDKQLYAIAAFVSIDEQQQAVEEYKRAKLESIRLDDKSYFYARKLALSYENIGPYDKIAELLEPYRREFEQDEGTRILGQFYANRNDYDAAIELLEPYVNTHLEQYQKASQAYDQRVDALWRQNLDEIEAGSKGKAFMEAFTGADEDRQRELIRQSFVEIRNSSAELAQAAEKYAPYREIPKAAMDLGVALLQKSFSIEDSAARTALLKRTESLFLTVQNDAGHLDEYNLTLGQIYYWLSQPDKGQELLNAYLRNNERSVKALYEVGRIKREVGERLAALDLLQEAYDKSNHEPSRQAIAELLSIMADSLAGQLEWIEKSDLTQAHNQAALHEVRARIAADRDDSELAIKEYRQAIGYIEPDRTDATSLNNLAMLYQQLYFLTRDAEDFHQYTSLMENAVRLDATDSILMANAADSLQLSFYQDFLAERIDLKLLDKKGDAYYFRYLYNNDGEKVALLADLAQNPHFQKYLKLRFQSLLLAPKSLGTYRELYSVYRFLGDEQGLKRLQQQATRAELQLPPVLPSTPEKSEDTQREQQAYQASQDFFQRLMEQARAGNDSATAAVAGSWRLNSMLDGFDGGLEVDRTAILAFAEANYRNHASSATRYDLYSTLLLLSSVSLQEVHEGYAALLRSNPGVNSWYLFWYAVAQDADGSLLGQLRQVPFFQQLIELNASIMNDFAYRDETDYLLERISGSPRLDATLEFLRRDGLSMAAEELHRLIYADSVEQRIDRFIRHKILGDESSAEQALERAVALGFQP